MLGEASTEPTAGTTVEPKASRRRTRCVADIARLMARALCRACSAIHVARSAFLSISVDAWNFRKFHLHQPTKFRMAVLRFLLAFFPR
jgi:hypothetical protein